MDVFSSSEKISYKIKPYFFLKPYFIYRMLGWVWIYIFGRLLRKNFGISETKEVKT